MLPTRPSRAVFLILGSLLAALAATWVHAALRTADAGPALERNRHLVHTLMLTDLALFTEARYTRHPSQADLFTPFQDHPLALEHFPSGSLIAPPAPWRSATAPQPAMDDGRLD